MPAMGLAGQWRIFEMSGWDRDAIDMLGPGFIIFASDGTGEFGFIAVRGQIDYRLVDRDGRAVAEFTWEGSDEGESVCGRGWASTGTANSWRSTGRSRTTDRPMSDRCPTRARITDTSFVNERRGFDRAVRDAIRRLDEVEE